MKIKRALISVYDKMNIVDMAKFLLTQDVEIISTGNTYKTLIESGVEVTEISHYIDFPEIMGGRVKTLHPKIHGGILSNRASHDAEIKQLGIKNIDLVIVNLYPFTETVKNSKSSEQEIIEQIDIGGITLLRAAAKNFSSVTIINDIEDYETLKQQMLDNAGATSLEYRKDLAGKAFALTAMYDTAIYNWFASQKENLDLPKQFILQGKKVQDLRSGENPHQKAAFYSNDHNQYPMRQLNGKELSYNNIIDLESAISIVSEFSEPSAVVIKHNNPCGAAIADNIFEACQKAIKCDEKSAFGGIIALNRPLDMNLATVLSKMFLEVIAATSFDQEALSILQNKKNLRIIVITSEKNPKYKIKEVTGGFLLQEQNDSNISEYDLKQVTEKTATQQEKNDLLFAWKICKHVKSNAIVVAKNGCTLGIGAGQMSRIDSINIAIEKAVDCQGAVLASDAFFPFEDSIIKSTKSGITAIIQPGGSIRDDEVIKEANSSNISMFFTYIRNFYH